MKMDDITRYPRKVRIQGFLWRRIIEPWTWRLIKASESLQKRLDGATDWIWQRLYDIRDHCFYWGHLLCPVCGKVTDGGIIPGCTCKERE